MKFIPDEKSLGPGMPQAVLQNKANKIPTNVGFKSPSFI